MHTHNLYYRRPKLVQDINHNRADNYNRTITITAQGVQYVEY